MIDTQGAKNSVADGPERGFDGGKKDCGRKRHLLTDTLGFLLLPWFIRHSCTTASAPSRGLR